MLDGRPATPTERRRRRRRGTAAPAPRARQRAPQRRARPALRARAARRGAARADAWLERLGVAQLAGGPRASLSGGEAQRISLARALVLEPRLLVLDEPFAPLDANTRGALLGELRELLAKAPATTLLATHDAGEAAALAHRIAVLDAGTVRQQGATADIFAHPRTPSPRACSATTTCSSRRRGQARLCTPRADRVPRHRPPDRRQRAPATRGSCAACRSPAHRGSPSTSGASTAVGICSELGGFLEGSPARVRLAAERCVPVGGADCRAGATRRRSDARARRRA